MGTHRALLYLHEIGKSEKLRPYAVPSQDWLEWVASQLQKGAPSPGLALDPAPEEPLLKQPAPAEPIAHDAE